MLEDAGGAAGVAPGLKIRRCVTMYQYLTRQLQKGRHSATRPNQAVLSDIGSRNPHQESDSEVHMAY